MSNGDDEEAPAEGAGEAADEKPAEGEKPAVDVSAEELEERLDEAEAGLEAAETEDDLDAVEARLDAIEADLEVADLPEPDDEDEEGPREQLESRLEGLRNDLEESRGPYAEDVASEVETAATTIRETRWTEAGKADVVTAVESFLTTADDHLADDFAAGSDDPDDLAAALEDAAGAIEDAGLDPDEDAETIEALLSAAEELSQKLDDAQEWDDLTIREKLRAQGFYDKLTPENRKDFPPEWNVVRVAEQDHDAETILTALGYFESEFMEVNCMEALERIAPPEAYDAMIQRAKKRDQLPIRVLGKIGDERALDTLVEFIEDDGNVPLQKTTLKAIGEIGSEETTQAVANRLVADDAEVRSHAARALGRIGDTRAIAPLSDVLGDEQEAAEVRSSAAWALVQIGTEEALKAAAEYSDDRSYTVAHEAQKAQDALGDEEAEAAA